MNDITFDTLRYFNKMKAAGVPEEQAQVQAEALQELTDRHLITKAHFDLKMAELENKIESNKHEVLKWVMGFLLAQTAVILSVIAFLK